MFVLDENRAITGIVTTANVAQRYGSMATPFFQVGELDQIRPSRISSSREMNELRSSGHYQRVLGNRDAWEKLG